MFKPFPKEFLKRILAIALLWSAYSNLSNAQSISVRVDDILSDKVFLQSYNGSKLEIIDTFQVVNDLIKFENKKYKEGLYRLCLANPADETLFKMKVPSFDFVISVEDISLQTSYFNPEKSMQVIQSNDNMLFYEYLQLIDNYRVKLGSLLRMLPIYSQEDFFYGALRNEILAVQKDYNSHLDSIAECSDHDFISAYLKFMAEPVFDPDMGMGIQEFMRNNFLEVIDFDSPALIHCPAYTEKILAYLSFFTNNNFTQEEQEDEFIRAVEKIMEKANYDKTVHTFVLDFLIEGFEKFQMEKVLVFIADSYLSGECETDNEKIMQSRLKAYQEMSVGKLVKNIQLRNENDEMVNLFDIQNEYTLILFWASWCPHCKKLISDLNKWYKTEAKLYDVEIFAVSIDTSKADWEEEVFLNDLSWINTIEPKAWEGKIAQQYNLYATPTMFLINRKREIVSKPLTMREFLDALKEEVVW